MSTIHLGEPLAALVAQAARQQTRSPQQQEAFTQGAALVAAFVIECGVEQTVLPQLRLELSELKTATHMAQAVGRDLSQRTAALSSPESLDARALGAVALTDSLLRVYERLVPERFTAEPSVRATIARAISYSVWAWLNPGAPMPTAAAEDVEK